MKILALDIGDKWIGSAISDGLGITCRPYKTVTPKELCDFLEKVLPEESIGKVVVGNPTTFSGGQSEQTKKTVKIKEDLEKQFPTIYGQKIEWILWDERLSSKRADSTKKKKIPSKEAKLQSHSVAAAFILQSYLDSLAFQKL